MTSQRWADVKEERAIRAEVRPIIAELKAVQRRIRALAVRAAEIPVSTGERRLSSGLQLFMGLDGSAYIGAILIARLTASSRKKAKGYGHISELVDELPDARKLPKKRRAAAARRPR